MRQVSPRARQVLFLRAVADLEFKEVGCILDVSTQAAHKMYGKALRDLAEALNGLSPKVSRKERQQRTTALGRISELAELRAQRAELSVVAAELSKEEAYLFM